MDKTIYYNDLYDLYHGLLTEKECSCFMDYFGEDLSLSEIAENNNVSKNAIHKMLKTVMEKLDHYEKELKLYQVKQEIKKIKKLSTKEEMIQAIDELI